MVVFGMGDGTGGGRGMGKQMGEVVGRREKVGTGIERRAGGGGGKGRKRLVQN